MDDRIQVTVEISQDLIDAVQAEADRTGVSFDDAMIAALERGAALDAEAE